MKGEVKAAHIVEYSVIDHEKRIGCLKINNGTFNTIDSGEFLDLEVLDQWFWKNKLKGLLILGAGRHFSSGANIELIKKYRHKPDALEETLNQGNGILHYIENLPAVTIAAVRGVCFGAGLEIALSCRYRICTENALFALPEVELGLMPGMGGLIRLSDLIGGKAALKYTLSGERIEAFLARDLGIVDKISKNKNLVSDAVELIDSLTGQITYQQAMCIFQVINSYEKNGSQESYKIQSRLFTELAKQSCKLF